MIEKSYLFHIFICHFLIIGSKDPSLYSKEMTSSKVKRKKSSKKDSSSGIFCYLDLSIIYHSEFFISCKYFQGDGKTLLTLVI